MKSQTCSQLIMKASRRPSLMKPFSCDHTLQVYPTQPVSVQQRNKKTSDWFSAANFPRFHSWMYEGGFRSARTKEPEMAALRLSLSLMCSSEGYAISSRRARTKLASETDGNMHVLMCLYVVEISSDPRAKRTCGWWQKAFQMSFFSRRECSAAPTKRQSNKAAHINVFRLAGFWLQMDADRVLWSKAIIYFVFAAIWI